MKMRVSGPSDVIDMGLEGEGETQELSVVKGKLDFGEH